MKVKLIAEDTTEDAFHFTVSQMQPNGVHEIAYQGTIEAQVGKDILKQIISTIDYVVASFGADSFVEQGYDIYKVSDNPRITRIGDIVTVTLMNIDFPESIYTKVTDKGFRLV